MGVRAWELGVSGEWQRVRANLHALDRTHLRQRPSHASNARHTRSRINPHVIWQGARDKEGLLRSDGSMLSREGSLDLKRPRRSCWRVVGEAELERMRSCPRGDPSWPRFCSSCNVDRGEQCADDRSAGARWSWCGAFRWTVQDGTGRSMVLGLVRVPHTR